MREFGCWVRRFLGIVVGCLWLNFKLEKIKICFENIELYFVNLFRAWLTNLTRTIKNILSTLHKVNERQAFCDLLLIKKKEYLIFQSTLVETKGKVYLILYT